MTLHEAIEKLLQQVDKPMTSIEIADALNKNKWYVNEVELKTPTPNIALSQIPYNYDKMAIPKTRRLFLGLDR